MLSHLQPRLIFKLGSVASYHRVQLHSQKLLSCNSRWKQPLSIRLMSVSSSDDISAQRNPANIGIKTLIEKEIGAPQDDSINIEEEGKN